MRWLKRNEWRPVKEAVASFPDIGEARVKSAFLSLSRLGMAFSKRGYWITYEGDERDDPCRYELREWIINEAPEHPEESAAA
jgi:hypothetical protein